MKKNSQKKVMLKPEVGDYYRDLWGVIFKIIRVDESLNEATYIWLSSGFQETWNYGMFPVTLYKKLTSLEIELL